MPLRTNLLLLGLICNFALPAAAGEILYADGRTAVASEPRKDSSGRWSAAIEGRRVVLDPGRIVAVTDDEGAISDLIPPLGDAPLTTEATAILASLRDAKNELWQVNFATIAGYPTRAMLDDLIELANDKNKALRLRAVAAMAQLYTRESVTTAAQTILAEKHKATRAEAASALFSVREIFVRSDAMQSVTEGIADDDKTVRVIFALLGATPTDGVDESVLAVLRKDGIGNKDHHIREEAALSLARHGDAAGLKILTGMLSRKAVPGLEDLSEETRTRMLIEEHVSICNALGRLGDPAALPALHKAIKSEHAAVVSAAEAAIAAIE